MNELSITLTTPSDINGKTYGEYCHWHRLVGEFDRRGHNIQAVCPLASQYRIVDSRPMVDAVFNVKSSQGRFKTVRGAEEARGDILFLHSYDETNDHFGRVDPFQSQFLHLLGGQFRNFVNTPQAERYTFKDQMWYIAHDTGLPIVPTSAFQEKGDLKDYIRQRGRVIVKPVDGAQGRGVAILDWEDKDLDTTLDGLDIPRVIFQPFMDYRAERQVFFIDSQVVGAVEKTNDGMFGKETYEETRVIPTEFDRTVVRTITKRTGLEIGRVDILYGVEGENDRVILELNGSGSGQFYYKGRRVIADYSKNIVDYCEYKAR